MREMTAEKAAAEIKRAYGTYRTLPGTNEYMMISSIADRVDLTIQEIHAGIRHLKRTDPAFHLIPESNQKALTPTDRAYAIDFGNQPKHLITWI